MLNYKLIYSKADNTMTYHLAKYTFSDNFNQFNEHRIINMTVNNDLMCLYSTCIANNANYARVYRQHPGSNVYYTFMFAIDMTQQIMQQIMQNTAYLHVLTIGGNPNVYHIIASNSTKLIAGFAIFINDGNPVIIDTFTSLQPDKLINYIYVTGSYIYAVGCTADSSYVIKTHVPHRNPGGQKLKPKDKPLKWTIVFECDYKLYTSDFASQNIVFTCTCTQNGTRFVNKYILNTADDTVTCSSHTYACERTTYYRTYTMNSLYDGHFILQDNNIINGHYIGTNDDAHNTWSNHHDFYHTADNPCWTVPELSWIKPDGSSHMITILTALSLPYFESFSFISPDVLRITWHNELGSRIRVLYHFDPDALTATPIMYVNDATFTKTHLMQTLVHTDDMLCLLSREPIITKDDIHTWLEPILPNELCELVHGYCRPVLPVII